MRLLSKTLEKVLLTQNILYHNISLVPVYSAAFNSNASVIDSSLAFPGNDLGLAFEISPQLKNQPFFASCVLKVFDMHY